MMVTFACVRTGSAYGPEYVHRLRAGIARYYPRPHRFVCITDNGKAMNGCERLEVADLPGWWAKMAVFDTSWRRHAKVVYLDLDTVVCGDLRPLADIDIKFGICANFTRAAGNQDWPCRYGSCVMTLAPDWGVDIWQRFVADKAAIIARNERYGDQKAIEELAPRASLLQEQLPPGYFIGYRDLPKHKAPPKGASLVIFAGQHKPHNTNCAWAAEAWAA